MTLKMAHLHLILNNESAAAKHVENFCQIRSKWVYYSGKDNYNPDSPEK